MKELNNENLINIYGGRNHFAYQLGKYEAKFLKAEATFAGIGLAAAAIMA
ncbi:hypothetical protein [Apilactobacillus kunkeei]|nr:hypothetical protein [Apilactobacillus kunkeei]